MAEAARARRKGLRVRCLYGKCFPDIDEVALRTGMARTPGSHCYEILLGSERFVHILDAEPGSFFVEKELLLNFDEYCWLPLELDDPHMREWMFESYRQLVYVRQPVDPDLGHTARRIAARLNLSLFVVDADYRRLDRELTRIMHTRVPP